MKLNIPLGIIIIFISVNWLSGQNIKEFTVTDSAIYPSFAVDKNGLIHAAWVYGDNRQIYYSVFDNEGNVIIRPNKNEESSGCSDTKVITKGEKKIIVWAEGYISTWNRWILGQQTNLYTDSPKTTIQYNDEFYDSQRYHPFPAFINDTTYYVLWCGPGPQFSSAVWGQKITTNFKFINNNISFSDSNSSVLIPKCRMPTLLNIPSQNKYCVLWIDNRKSNFNLYARFFDYNDNPLTSSFRINDNEGVDENIWFYSAKLSKEDEIIIVWCDKVDEYWQLFLKKIDSNGNSITTSTQLTSVSDYVAYAPNIDLAVDDQSNIAVAWERYISSQPVKISIRLFDKSLNIIGGIENVSVDTSSGHQFLPQIQFVDKNLYCMWYGHSIKMRIFSIDEITDVIENEIKDFDDDVTSRIKDIQNYPNPFNNSTSINFILLESSQLQIKVYDLLGREVETLADTYFQSGNHKINLTSQLPSGIYLVMFSSPQFHITKKIITIK